MVYLSCPHTLLSLSFVPPLTKVWGMTPRGYGAMDKEGEMVENSWVLEPGWGALTMSELNSQLHTHTFNGRKKRRGDRKLENGRNR